MGTNHATTLGQASFSLLGLGAGLQVGGSLLSRLLSKCHVAIFAASLLPAIVASYGPQLAAPLPPTITFSNRSAYLMVFQAIKQFLKMNKNIFFERPLMMILSCELEEWHQTDLYFISSILLKSLLKFTLSLECLY